MVHAAVQLLYGEYRMALDDKRRVVIPSEWREILGTHSIYGYRKDMILPNVGGTTPCLVMGEESILIQRITECKDLPPEDQARLDAVTTFIINRIFDNQGRVVLRAEELEYLKINQSRIVLYGNLDRFIVTNPDRPIGKQPNKPSPLECM